MAVWFERYNQATKNWFAYCQKKRDTTTTDNLGKANLVLQVLSRLDSEIADSLEDPDFIGHLVKAKFKYGNDS